MFTIQEKVIAIFLFGFALGQSTTGTAGTSLSIPTRPGLRDPSCPYPAFNVTYLPYPQDCSRYYQCYDGYKYLLQCSKGQWWDQRREMCSSSRDHCNVDFYESTRTTAGTAASRTTWWFTTDRPTTQTTATGTTEGPTTRTTAIAPSTTTGTTGTTSTPVDPRCPHGSDRYLPLPGECHFYVECRNDRSFIIACPPKLYFSETRKLCVPKEQSECCRLHTCAS